AAAVAAWTTFRGVVSGRIVRHSPKNVIARVSLFGMRNPRTTVALVLATTVVAGYYASLVTTNVDVADVLPRGDPNTDAAHNLTQKFKSSFTQQVTFQFRVLDVDDPAQAALYEANNASLPARKTEARPDNITDEVYVRAMAETIAYVVAQEPFAGSTGSPDFFKLINWTIAGGQNATDQAGAFSLPPTDEMGELRYATVEEAVFRVVYGTVDAVTSPNWTQTAILVTVSPDSEVSAKHIGQRALEVRGEWVERVRRDQTDFSVFGPENPPMFTVDLPLANAHASELTARDFRTLMPLIGVFVAITLFIAFRNAASVVVTFSALAIAVVWTFGAMGALRIPLNTINLAVVPLIMGVGIDYGIHMMNEFQEYRGQGKSAEEAWTLAGGGSAFALFVGALTTAAGLVVMVVSPSLLVAQLGILGNVALASCYVLAVLFIPAAYTLLGGSRKARQRQAYRPSRLMPAFAYGVSRARVLAVVVVLLMAGAAVASQANLRREAFGDPPRNWLPGDPLREEHLRAIQGFYETGTDDVKANVIVLEGDVTDPAMHAYINGITGTLRRNAVAGEYRDPATNETRESRVIADTLRDLPFLLNTWLTVKDGVPGAAQFLGAPALEQLFARLNQTDPTGKSQPYPDTSEEMRRELDAVFESPLRQFGNLFVDHPDYDMTVIVFSVRAATYPDAESVWNEVQAAILENEPLRPEGVKTSFFGNTAINYLFVAKQVPWLNAMNLVTVGLVVVIVFLFTRRIGPTLAVGGVSALTSTLWFGLLPVLDIGLAISLTLPLIFITAMGSDYALHLALRASRTGNARETFEGVGKGVLFSFVTTFGAFVIFT
ncbi:MAG TPA: MMPL family transporter, partial [Candidatus Thermoplasmatota archaeon]|nr:MMPL family transporter [Candidatus Thermoplasmatota archaeon]